MATRRVLRVTDCLTCPCSRSLQHHILCCQLADIFGTPQPATSDFVVPPDCPLHTKPVVLKPKEGA